MPKAAYNPECLVPTLNPGGGFVMIWAAKSWYSVRPIITLNGRITASDYVDILTYCRRVTQICVFNTVKLGTSASSP